MPLGDEDQMTVTSCLKYFLREMLPEPVIPEGPERQKWFEASQIPQGDPRIEAFRACIANLSHSSTEILNTVIAHLYKVMLKADQNKMMASNLGVVFGPTLLWSSGTSGLGQIADCNKVGEHLIEYEW